jgi:hypothetical protein
MGGAFVLLGAGLTVLTSNLEANGERLLSRLGLVAIILAAGLWLTFYAFRAVVTVGASEEMAARRF